MLEYKEHLKPQKICVVQAYLMPYESLSFDTLTGKSRKPEMPQVAPLQSEQGYIPFSENLKKSVQ